MNNEEPAKKEIEIERKDPSVINSSAIFLTGIAEIVQQKLDDSQHCGGIDDSMNLVWSFMAISEMAKNIADEIRKWDSILC